MKSNPNSYKNQKIRGVKRKYESIIKRGGKCQICGYNENLSALEFHHNDPGIKEFQLDVRHFSNTTLSKLEKELDKCIIICANCHRELHNPNLTFDNIPIIIEHSNKNSFSNTFGRDCPVCGKRFPKSKKVYCSKKCREENKNYPSIDQLNNKYIELKSWEKVAQYFGITRKITRGIREKPTLTISQ